MRNKKENIDTDTLWEIVKLHARYCDCLHNTELDGPKVYGFEESIEHFIKENDFGDATWRKSAMVYFSDADSGLRAHPNIFDRFCDEVLKTYDVRYKRLVLPPEATVRKISKRGRISNEREFELISELASSVVEEDQVYLKDIGVERINKWMCDFEDKAKRDRN